MDKSDPTDESPDPSRPGRPGPPAVAHTSSTLTPTTTCSTSTGTTRPHSGHCSGRERRPPSSPSTTPHHPAHVGHPAPEVIAAEVERLRRDDPTRGDIAAVERRLADVGRQRANLTKRLALFDDDEAAAPVVVEISSLTEQLRQLEREREGLEAQRRGWEIA